MGHWEKVRRTDSKRLETPPPAAKPMGGPPTPTKTPTPKPPAKPTDKPPHPYELNESEGREFRWRWVEASSAEPDDYPDTDELVRYTLEVLSRQTDDPLGYIAAVDAEERKQKRLARRAYRMAVFLGHRT